MYDSTDRLREKRTRGWERVQNHENFAYVLNGWSLTVERYLNMYGVQVPSLVSDFKKRHEENFAF